MQSKIVLLSLFCIVALSLNAQIRDDPEDAYNQESFIGVNTGATFIVGDLTNTSLSSSYSINYSHNRTPNFSYGCEVAFGTLSSYTPANYYTSGLTSNNSFTAFNVNARYSFNNIFKSHDNKNKETISRLYWGLGLGIINNNLINLTEKYRQEQNYKIANIKAASLAGVVLENIGVDIKLPHSQFFHNAIFNVNFQANYAFSDYIDGYSFVGSSNQFNDIYFILSIGVHFYFGEKVATW